MANKKRATSVFDPQRFGNALRAERRKKGYTNTRVFSEAIQKETDVFIDFDTLMKYERGEREPDVTKLVAIAFTLFKTNWIEELETLLIASLPFSPNGNSIYSYSLVNKKNLERKNADYVSKIAALSQAFDITYSAAEKLYNNTPYGKEVDAMFDDVTNELETFFKDEIEKERNRVSGFSNSAAETTPPAKGVNDK